MRLRCVGIFLVFCVWDLTGGLEIYEDRRRYFGGDESGPMDSDGYETEDWTENALTELLRERPVALVLELRESLLMKVKARLENESESDFPVRKTLLATFDSTGLIDASVYNDTEEIRDAIKGLVPIDPEGGVLPPTTHVLGELLKGDLPEGFLLLVAMSKPSDEDFSQNLITSLLGKKCQLSVLWAGNYPSDEYLQLRKISETTGGKFGFLINDGNTDDNLTEPYLPKTEIENLSQQLKFPEENDNASEDAPSVTRTADQKVAPKAVVPLTVEVASGSSLEARPGVPTQIQFTVKNNLNVPLLTRFDARYNGLRQDVQPIHPLLPPSVPVTVIVNLHPIGAPQSSSAVGTLTLSALAGTVATTRQAMIFLTPQTATDNYAPKLTYRYEGDCTNYKDPQTCEQANWRLEATLQDEDSGLLKVMSEPYGLLFQSQFVAGTRTPVTVYYDATCCQPNVIIWAEDLKGNYVKKGFDVFNQNLLAGEIASIVLGVLILLIIVIAIFVAIVLVRKRNQRNLIIPRPRSGSR